MTVLTYLAVLLVTYCATSTNGQLMTFLDSGADVVPSAGHAAQSPVDYGGHVDDSSSSDSDSSSESEEHTVDPKFAAAIAHRIVQGRALKVSYVRRRSWSFTSRTGRPERHHSGPQKHHEGRPIHHGVALTEPASTSTVATSSVAGIMSIKRAIFRHNRTGNSGRKPNQHRGKKPLTQTQHGEAPAKPLGRPNSTTSEKSTVKASVSSTSKGPTTKPSIAPTTDAVSTNTTADLVEGTTLQFDNGSSSLFNATTVVYDFFMPIQWLD